MQSNKLFGLVSLSRKAGMLTYGFDAVKDAATSGKAHLVLFSQDVSPKTRRAMEWALENAACRVPLRATGLPMHEYGRICGKATGVLALTDKGFADAVLALLEADDVQEPDALCTREE